MLIFYVPPSFKIMSLFEALMLINGNLVTRHLKLKAKSLDFVAHVCSKKF